MHRLTPAEARSIAVRASRLDADRPADIVETIDALRTINIDPTAAIAPSADHILWSRIGWPYEPADLVRAVESDRTVFEWAGFYRPMGDLPLYRPMMRSWPPYARHREWLAANASFADDILAVLAERGPTRSGEIPDTSAVSWTSTGWTDARNVTQMLEFLALRGEIAVSGREGRERLWDLAERVYPDGPDLDEETAALRRSENRLRALGIARAKSTKQPGEPIDVGEVGEVALVEGVAGTWRIDPVVANLPTAPGRAALLSPFDRFVFDRRRAQELFGFEYILEMYKPAAARRWGYFALPILVGDALIGKLDAKVREGRLHVYALHEDRVWTPAEREAVEAELDDLARWGGWELVGAGRA